MIQPLTTLGLMSGTSADGIDAVCMQITPEKHRILGQHSIRYPANFQAQLREAMQAYATDPQSNPNLNAIANQSTQYHIDITRTLLDLCELKPQQIDAIGYHGQTLHHAPPISVQAGNPQILSDHIGCPVIGDVRQADLALGGQGAPIAPTYHQWKLQQGIDQAVIVNCGGIANITVISGRNWQDIYACDTGPGNTLIDQLVQQRTQGQLAMDKDGHLGCQGSICEATLAQLHQTSCMQQQQNYLALPAPKSLCVSDCHLIEALNLLSLEDACATLAMFTAQTIVASLSLWPKLAPPQTWVLAGGGWYNQALYQALQQCLQEKIGTVTLHTADELGWSNTTFEAEMMALVAAYHLWQKPFTFPNTTGTTQPTILGKYYSPAR